MDKLCTNYVQIMFKLCTNYVQIMYKLCTNYVQIMYKLSTNFVQIATEGNRLSLRNLGIINYSLEGKQSKRTFYYFYFFYGPFQFKIAPGKERGVENRAAFCQLLCLYFRYRVSQKTWEFSDEFDIVFVMN